MAIIPFNILHLCPSCGTDNLYSQNLIYIIKVALSTTENYSSVIYTFQATVLKVWSIKLVWWIRRLALINTFNALQNKNTQSLINEMTKIPV